MNSEQLQHFKAITLDYFGKLTNMEKLPSMGEAYIQFAEPVLLDYASMIEISGESRGCIYMTSDIRMLEELLAVHGEGELSDRTRLDMCRELSNVLAGNAMHAFGDDWQISVPRTLCREDMTTLDLPASTFVMPIEWMNGRSFLVIGLTNKAA